VDPLERAVRACRNWLTPEERNLVAPLFLTESKIARRLAGDFDSEVALAEACLGAARVFNSIEESCAEA
jgi:hypothetical protein